MFKNKKIILSTLLILILGIITGCTSKNNANSNTSNNKDFLITLVLDKGGVNDESFNQSAWKGAQRAKKELGVNVKYLESKSDADYKSNIETAIELNSDLIIGVGFNLSSAIEEAANHYPDQKFAIVDGSFDKIPKNVTPISFDEKGAGYLAGLAAAKSLGDNCNSYGFIGGFEIPAVVNYKDGFEEGILSVNKNAKLSVQYANSFSDAAKGKAIASTMYSNGVDCIMTAAGGVNTGVYESGAELKKYAVAVDLAQSNLSPDVILTSATKNVDIGVFDCIKNLTENKLEGGTTLIYNIDNGGVGYEKTKLISNDTISFVDEKMNSLKSN